jgi:DNA-binding SARP family transcriptional activator
MDYRVLGPLEVLEGDRSLPLAGAKQRALLALLLLNANRVISRDRLIDGLWGEQPPETAVQSLQVYVSRLRKLLPAKTLLSRPPGYLLEIDADELDLRRFARLLGDGREALAVSDPQRAAGLLHDALALWRGPALAEFVFEPFAQGEIGRLEDLRLAAVEERIAADLALGRHADLIGELEALIAENPHRERLRGQLMVALYRSGRQAEALEAYREARRALVDELGIEPSEHLGRGGPGGGGAFLDRIHAEAAAEIEAAGGTVEKGLAGALLATFGAELAREDSSATPRSAKRTVTLLRSVVHRYPDRASMEICRSRDRLLHAGPHRPLSPRPAEIREPCRQGGW